MENQPKFNWDNFNKDPMPTNTPPNQPPMQQQPMQEQPKWESPQQDFKWGGWDNNPTEPTPSENINSEPFQSNENIVNNFSWDKEVLENQEKITQLETAYPIQVAVEVWNIKSDLQGILSEISQNELTPLGNDGIFKLTSDSNPLLSSLVNDIKEISDKKNHSITNLVLYKNSPGESSLNLFRTTPSYNFIYFLQSDSKGCDLVVDFSSFNGPSSKIVNPIPGQLIIFPGWLPYRLSRNMSLNDFVAIGGSLD